MVWFGGISRVGLSFDGFTHMHFWKGYEGVKLG